MTDLKLVGVGLTPEEIERQVFLVSLRGYDKDEVHAFLNQVASDYRQALQRSEAGEQDPYGRLGDEVAEMLRTTVEQTRQLRERVEREVAESRQRAEAEIATLRAEAEADAARIRNDADAHADWVRREAAASAREHIQQIVSDALNRYADADEAERALMEHLEAVQTAVEETRRRLGDRPLLALLEEATSPFVTTDDHD